MRKVVSWSVYGIIVVVIGGALYIWGRIDESLNQPRVEAQVLAFATLPVTLDLPTKEENGETKPDFQVVEKRLIERLPIGTSEADINAYLIEQQKPCLQNEKAIYCVFRDSNIACNRFVTVYFYLAASKLREIDITSGNVCL